MVEKRLCASAIVLPRLSWPGLALLCLMVLCGSVNKKIIRCLVGFSEAGWEKRPKRHSRRLEE